MIVNKLVEPYPSKCFNNGKLANQTQLYYFCMKKNFNTTEQPFRVTKETYDMLYRNYTFQYRCYKQEVEKQVCVCP